MALRSYYDCLLEGKPFAPLEGKMVSLMATEGEASPAKISRDEIIANAVTMSIAGYYSTTFLIGTGTLNLLNNPNSMKSLRKSIADGDDSLLQSAILEMLRYDGPVQLIDRYAAEDTEIADVKIPKNQKVTAVVGSANHDEAEFPYPEKFDITRNAEPMLSFGEGMHRCLGEPLFKKVAPVAFKTLLNARPEFKLAGMPQWQTDPYLRAVSNLPLEFLKMDG
jgi:pimeloyl-[acyl-carrier protein] synthase